MVETLKPLPWCGRCLAQRVRNSSDRVLNSQSNRVSPCWRIACRLGSQNRHSDVSKLIPVWVKAESAFVEEGMSGDVRRLSLHVIQLGVNARANVFTASNHANVSDKCRAGVNPSVPTAGRACVNPSHCAVWVVCQPGLPHLPGRRGGRAQLHPASVLERGCGALPMRLH